MKSFFMSVFLAVLTACSSSLTNDLYEFGDEFELALGEKVTVGREKLSVEFTDVLEDSRCPSNVTCVWAGNGKVQIRLTNEEVVLNTYLDPKESTVEEVHIELLSLEPYPEDPRQFEKDDYIVRLLISKE